MDGMLGMHLFKSSRPSIVNVSVKETETNKKLHPAGSNYFRWRAIRQFRSKPSTHLNFFKSQNLLCKWTWILSFMQMKLIVIFCLNRTRRTSCWSPTCGSNWWVSFLALKSQLKSVSRSKRTERQMSRWLSAPSSGLKHRPAGWIRERLSSAVTV